MLFSQVINNKWLDRTNVILFLNKTDLFQESLRTNPDGFYACFPDYKGSVTFGSALGHVRDAFLKQEKALGGGRDKRHIYPYETCATDTQCISRVFEAIADIFLTKNIATFI